MGGSNLDEDVGKTNSLDFFPLFFQGFICVSYRQTRYEVEKSAESVELIVSILIITIIISLTRGKLKRKKMGK